MELRQNNGGVHKPCPIEHEGWHMKAFGPRDNPSLRDITINPNHLSMIARGHVSHDRFGIRTVARGKNNKAFFSNHPLDHLFLSVKNSRIRGLFGAETTNLTKGFEQYYALCPAPNSPKRNTRAF